MEISSFKDGHELQIPSIVSRNLVCIDECLHFHEDVPMTLFMISLAREAWKWYRSLPTSCIASLKDFHILFHSIIKWDIPLSFFLKTAIVKVLNQFQRIYRINLVIVKRKGKSLMMNMNNILKANLTIKVILEKIALQIQMKRCHWRVIAWKFQRTYRRIQYFFLPCKILVKILFRWRFCLSRNLVFVDEYLYFQEDSEKIVEFLYFDFPFWTLL